MNTQASLPVLGWREWAALPALGVRAVLAKIDTGARSCALHVGWQRCFSSEQGEQVAFALRTDDGTGWLECTAAVHDRRVVTASNGHSAERVFIRTCLKLGYWQREVELGLTQRVGLRHPMLIGRTALAGAWWIDPARSFVLGEIPGEMA